ncbi:MAG: Co2+/Mg2+ efflux protein ApaG [Zoogloeaceae bacterium]|nr:Co2+/Mg2+ efflux protein ApaG [Zoogloeaceae bacterium]
MLEKYRIDVHAVAQYIADQSDPEEDKYVFAYRVVITNRGTIAAQLRSRHWIITDGEGKVQEVKGSGVVGEQPQLEPGESFEYTSGSVLATPVGTMHGSYQMVAEDGHHFDAAIQPFSLAMPSMVN